MKEEEVEDALNKLSIVENAMRSIRETLEEQLKDLLEEKADKKDD